MQHNGYELRSRLNAHSMFKLSLACNQDFPYEYVLSNIKLKVIFTDPVCCSDSFCQACTISELLGIFVCSVTKSYFKRTLSSTASFEKI